MAVSFYIMNKGFTPEKHAEAIKQLELAGAGAPEGRTYHAALETNGEINVFDIWESQEAFEAFGPTLNGLGVEAAEPMVAPVHNVIVG